MGAFGLVSSFVWSFKLYTLFHDAFLWMFCCSCYPCVPWFAYVCMVFFVLVVFSSTIFFSPMSRWSESQIFFVFISQFRHRSSMAMMSALTFIYFVLRIIFTFHFVVRRCLLFACFVFLLGLSFCLFRVNCRHTFILFISSYFLNVFVVHKVHTYETLSVNSNEKNPLNTKTTTTTKIKRQQSNNERM